MIELTKVESDILRGAVERRNAAIQSHNQENQLINLVSAVIINRAGGDLSKNDYELSADGATLTERPKANPAG